MKKQIKERLEELKAEYESGQKMLADLEAQEEEENLDVVEIVEPLTQTN